MPDIHNKPDSQANPDTKRSLLLDWLKNRIDDKAYSWIQSTSDDVAAGMEDWKFFSSFSAVPRHTGKSGLNLTDDEIKKADNLRPGWNPQQWSCDQAGRTILVLSLASQGKETFQEKLEKLFISSDMSEAVALYQSLPVLPWPESLKARTAEGIRSNMTNVFNVIAHHNPYPADWLDEPAWNQMVLKALFVQSPLWPIQGLDRRANPELARMLSEYADERRAAGREISPELWRPVGPFLTEKTVGYLEEMLNSGDQLQQEAAALALADSDLPAASKLLEKHSQLATQVADSTVNWDEVGKKAAANK